jgi:hypothetical protein
MARDVRLIRSPISVAGMVLTTISAVLFLIVFLADVFGLHTNPYLGIVFFLLLPALFLAGLVLIPLGAWIERRRRRAGKPPSEASWPRFDLNDPVQRTRAILVFALTMANIVVVSLAAYRGVEYMDSPQFCGQTCHVMKPEFVAYHDAPHSQVRCVECHVGSGATSFVQSKLSGVRRVVALARGTYARPILPPQNLRPARETCAECHWPEKFHGDVVRTITEYGDDEANTPTTTTLQLHVGGGARAPVAKGIHWHMNVANEIDFVAADADRQTIPYVRVKTREGSVREYFAEGVARDHPPAGALRRMDCLDCHNRPSHPIAPTAERAVNELMATGHIPTSLPFVHREAVKALKTGYPTQEAGADGVARAIRGFYQAEPGPERRRPDVDQAVDALVGAYRRNVFPEMNVRFGTYVTNIGHIDFPGCFRCHDDRHTTRDGKTIGQECDTCHGIS